MTDAGRVVIVGGGHNGLVCAAWLARAGRKVLVFEAADQVGGVAVTREFSPGFRVSSGAHLLHALDPVVERTLKLASHGLALARTGLNTVALGEGGPLVLNGAQVLAGEVSATDRLALAQHVSRQRRYAALLARQHGRIPSTPWNLAKFALDIRRLGRADMRELLRELAPVQRLSAPASLPGRTSAADALSHEPFAAVVGRQLLALLPPTTRLQLALSEWPPQRVELELMCLQVIQDLASAACARGPLGLLIVGALSDARHLSLTVADDATPCPQGDATLAALRERVEQAGGHLSHSARASGGTRVVVSFARMDRGPGKP